MDNIMLVSELGHLFLTALIGFFLFWKYRDGRLILSGLLFGFLIDFDHLFDFFSFFKTGFNLKYFFDVDQYMLPAGKIYVLLHGWEY